MPTSSHHQASMLLGVGLETDLKVTLEAGLEAA
jgi:hypothetical protein